MNPMSMSQRWRRVMKEWIFLFLLLVALSVLYFAGFVVIDPRPTQSLTPIWVLTGLYLVGLTAVLIIFYWRVTRADIPPEYRFALKNGLPATARVLEIEQTRWKNRRYRRLDLRIIPLKWEYAMHVRVNKSDGSTYDVPLNVFLLGSQVPKEGDIIPVKVHPEYPNVVVWGAKTTV